MVVLALVGKSALDTVINSWICSQDCCCYFRITHVAASKVAVLCESIEIIRTVGMLVANIRHTYRIDAYIAETVVVSLAAGSCYLFVVTSIRRGALVTETSRA